MERYEKIFILCPATVSGGPEAIHQLAQITNELGVRTYIAYYDRHSPPTIDRSRVCYEPASANPCLSYYQKYNPVAAADVNLSETTLLILPEVLFDTARQVRDHTAAIWWLSVDNAFSKHSKLRDPEYRKSFFANDRIIHLCQTHYAREVLRGLGVKQTYDLVDYTDDLFTLMPPKVPNSGNRVAYNPRKGGDLAQTFFAKNPAIDATPIQDMTKMQIYEAFRDTQIYVEFGHNPGKDRLPREAACAGCIVLVRDRGGSSFFGDTPLDQFFKFSEDDVTSGVLTGKIRDIRLNPGEFWKRQAFYRNVLYAERELMRLQARQLFAL